MSEFQNINLNPNQMSEWQQTSAFNQYYTYSFVNRSAYYAMVGANYYDFMDRWVKNWLWWYDGWVPYFHNADKGIFSTRIATALVDRTANKVAGGRVMFKNEGKEKQSNEKLNLSLKAISNWANKTNFEIAFKKAIKYAAAAGTSLLKINQDGDFQLWVEALRFDSFLPTVDFKGQLTDIKCFIQSYTKLGEKDKQLDKVYYITEHRYYGTYNRLNGEKVPNAALVEYEIKALSGTVTTGKYISQSQERILWEDLPKDIKSSINKNYSSVEFDKPMPLPFSDLGAELILWTDGISNLPELPFGESLLAKLVSYLEAYDYYFSAFCTDMYTGRARVLVPKGMTKADGQSNMNSGLDSYLYARVDLLDPEKQTPLPIQFELRAEEWRAIRDSLIQNIAINTGLNISTIASFLNDTTGNKTAREISTEENETMGYVNFKRGLIEKPVNRLLKTITRYLNEDDAVIIRWSHAELTNRALLSEILSTARAGGFVSQKKAVEMFNFDDDDEQIQIEYDSIKADEAGEAPIGEGFFDEVNDTEIDNVGK